MVSQKLMFPKCHWHLLISWLNSSIFPPTQNITQDKPESFLIYTKRFLTLAASVVSNKFLIPHLLDPYGVSCQGMLSKMVGWKSGVRVREKPGW